QATARVRASGAALDIPRAACAGWAFRLPGTPPMRLPISALAALALLAACSQPAPKPATTPQEASESAMTMTNEDPWLWLEDIHGERPLAWVREQNARTAQAFAATPAFERLRADILEVLDSDAR